MDVVLLERVVDHPEVLLRTRVHHALEHFEEATRSQVPHPAVDPPGHVYGKAMGQHRPRQMRHAPLARAVLPRTSSARATPTPSNLRLGPKGDFEVELRALDLRHFD